MHLTLYGLSWWLSWWRISLQCRRPGFNPWIGKIPWRREWLPPPAFWPEEFHGLYSPQGRKESDTPERLSLSRYNLILYIFSACSWTFYVASSLICKIKSWIKILYLVRSVLTLINIHPKPNQISWWNAKGTPIKKSGKRWWYYPSSIALDILETYMEKLWDV